MCNTVYKNNEETHKADKVSKLKIVHLHLFDDSFQLSDLALYCLLVGQDEVDFLGDLVL